MNTTSSNSSVPSVAVCVITLRRPLGLEKLLLGLAAQELSDPNLLVSVVVVENEFHGPGREVCDRLRPEFPFPLRFVEEPKRGIPSARNRAIEEAGEVQWIAMIDDDEIPKSHWLDNLLRAQRKYEVDIVAGPVLPEYDEDVPVWVRESRVFERRRLPTGTPLVPMSTSNVLVGRECLRRLDPIFDESLALCGGSDTHLFRRLARLGCRAVWADDAIVRESVPRSRATSGWLVRRAFRSGANYTRTAFDLDSRSQALAETLWQTGKYLGWGIVGLPLAVLRGRSGLVRHAKHLARGAGLLAGLAGFQHEEYRTIHGR